MCCHISRREGEGGMSLKERVFFLLFYHCVDLYSRNFVVITICMCFWCVETTKEHVCMCTSIEYNIGSSKTIRHKIPMQNTNSPFAWVFFIQLTYQIHVLAFCYHALHYLVRLCSHRNYHHLLHC